MNYLSHIEAFYDSKYHAAEGMIKFGGSFTHFLGHALARADTANSFKIFEAFPVEWDQHELLYRKFLEKQAKENEVE